MPRNKYNEEEEEEEEYDDEVEEDEEEEDGEEEDEEEEVDEEPGESTSTDGKKTADEEGRLYEWQEVMRTMIRCDIVIRYEAHHHSFHFAFSARYCFDFVGRKR